MCVCANSLYSPWFGGFVSVGFALYLNSLLLGVFFLMVICTPISSLPLLCTYIELFIHKSTCVTNIS